MKPKVLVVGAAGQLGVELVAHLQSRPAEVFGLARADLDVTRRHDVMAVVEALAPTVIIHAGAWTAVDECESDPDRAFAVNALGPRHLAEAARRRGAHLCVISTDYVFDGTSGRPYREWDATNPLSVYGRSKLAGEMEAGPSATVVRTSWLFGAHGSNFVKTILRASEVRDELSVVDDQHGCPTEAAGLAAVVCELALSGRSGVHHVTNQGATSWFELAREVMVAAGRSPDRVVPISTKDLDPPRPAPRPEYSVLDNYVLRAAGFPLLPDWREPLHRLVPELAAEGGTG